MASFTPIPAIDIRGGRCVRLVQGDFLREKAYGDDPAEMARHWQAEGAQRLHVVDLDGARDGVRGNASVIRRLIASVHIPVQVGGGVRSISTGRTLLEEGADRVIVGTAAAEHPETLSEWVDMLGVEHLIVGVDARQGRVATRGWKTLTDIDVLTFCQQLRQSGVGRVLYTDIGRDGLLGGPDVDMTRAIAGILKVIGSGGVSTIDDLTKLAGAGAEGAIIGTALYEGHVELREAIAAC